MPINYESVIKMLNKTKENNVYIHAMNVLKDGEVVLSFAIPPYNSDDRRQVFSMSKSFTSIAVGICYDEGLLSLEDRLEKFFPLECYESGNERSREITISNLLTMSSGHNACSMEAIRNSNNGPKTFLSIPLDHESGTEFNYNTGATYMLSAIVQKVTGMKLVDYLYDRLFKPLNIPKPYWACSGGNICEGGVGLFISSNDICKFATMLYNNGVYNGKRIVSEEYLALATSKRIITPPATIDWIQGYGYQFWINRENGFRADGAFGQLCVILKDRNVAYTILGEVHNMQTEMDLCYEMLDELFEDSIVNENDFERYLSDYYNYDTFCSLDISSIYNIDKDYEWIKIKSLGNNLELILKNDHGEQVIRSVCGGYTKNEGIYAHLIPDFYDSPDRAKYKRIISYSTHYFKNGSLYLVNRYVEYPHTLTWRFDFDGDSVSINISSFTSQLIVEHCSLNGQKRIDNIEV